MNQPCSETFLSHTVDSITLGTTRTYIYQNDWIYKSPLTISRMPWIHTIISYLRIVEDLKNFPQIISILLQQLFWLCWRKSIQISKNVLHWRLPDPSKLGAVPCLTLLTFGSGSFEISLNITIFGLLFPSIPNYTSKHFFKKQRKIVSDYGQVAGISQFMFSRLDSGRIL